MKKQHKIELLISRLDELIQDIQNREQLFEKPLSKVHPENLLSAKNLIHYRTLRNHDIRQLQKSLGNMGLSRLAKTQANVLAGLKTTKRILESFLGHTTRHPKTGLSFKHSKKLSKKNVKRLLGFGSKKRSTRIMVTLPEQAAVDYKLVEKMIAAGMNIARINCAHNTHEEWLSMINHVKQAATKLKQKCKIAMDLAGPKIRTGTLPDGPKVKKLRPGKDERGYIKTPLIFLLQLEDNPNHNLASIPFQNIASEYLKPGVELYFLDARNKKRPIQIIERTEGGWLASIHKTTYFETGLALFNDKTCSNVVGLIGELPPTDSFLQFKVDDCLDINLHTPTNELTNCNNQISCTATEVFQYVKIGDPILFDDGKIRGLITSVSTQKIGVQIKNIGKNGKLRSDKGINLPKSKLEINALTDKDRADLPFIVEYADMVNASFINTSKDVKSLCKLLDELNASADFGVILKIETQKAYDELPKIILEGLKRINVGIMIARGDLAVEVGWDNIGRVQQEILRLCYATHMPVIWATQVLENLAKTGVPSRPEITDIVKAQQADCIMLNKGPYILDAIQFLNDVLQEMDTYQDKAEKLLPRWK